MAIHRPESAAMDCRATLAMTKVNDWQVCHFLLPNDTYREFVDLLGHGRTLVNHTDEHFGSADLGVQNLNQKLTSTVHSRKSWQGSPRSAECPRLQSAH